MKQVFALFSALSLLLVPAAASASPTPDPPSVVTTSTAVEDEQNIIDFWNEYDVPENTQNSLLDAIRNGDFTEASRAGVEPVESEEITKNGVQQTIERFSDGSIRVTGIQKPTKAKKGTASTYAGTISGCSTTSGAGWATYKGCLVSIRTDTLYLSFKATYEKYSGASAKILSTYSPAMDTYGGVQIVTAPTRSRWVPNSSTTGQAVATYRATIKSWNGGSSEVVYLSLRLNTSGSASVTNY